MEGESWGKLGKVRKISAKLWGERGGEGVMKAVGWVAPEKCVCKLAHIPQTAWEKPILMTEVSQTKSTTCKNPADHATHHMKHT